MENKLYVLSWVVLFMLVTLLVVLTPVNSYSESYSNRNGVNGGYVGSDLYFKKAQESAAQRKLLEKGIKKKQNKTGHGLYDPVAAESGYVVIRLLVTANLKFGFMGDLDWVFAYKTGTDQSVRSSIFETSGKADLTVEPGEYDIYLKSHGKMVKFPGTMDVSGFKPGKIVTVCLKINSLADLPRLPGKPVREDRHGLQMNDVSTLKKYPVVREPIPHHETSPSTTPSGSESRKQPDAHEHTQRIFSTKEYVVEKYSGDEMYEGEIVNGKRNGEGTYTYADGKKYIGKWIKGMRHGKGTLYTKKGEIALDGIWANDRYIGTNR